jgi:hypothetical protein
LIKWKCARQTVEAAEPSLQETGPAFRPFRDATLVILSDILAENKQESGSVIPFLVTEQRLGWTPKRQWPPLLNRSVDSVHLSPSTRERILWNKND